MIYRNLMLAAGIALLAAGCSGEKINETPSVPKTGGEGANGVRTISVGGESSAQETRVTYDDGVTYKWTPGDRMGFYMVDAANNEVIVSNARFKSMNTAPAVSADFEGEVSETSLSKVSADRKYDYYSYYPYNANAGSAGFPNVAFSIPNEITLSPDVFPTQYGFMVGGRVATADGEKPVSWLQDGEQQLGKRVSFQYKHVFAFLEVHLRLNLMSQPINKIVVTCTDGAMSGTAHVNLETGAMSFVSSSNSITVNLTGTGIDAAAGRIWIPINPALAGKQFRFDFYTTGGNMVDRTITGGALAAGMKHKAGFRLPFHINFDRLKADGLEGKTKAFKYQEYDFNANGDCKLGEDHVKLNNDGYVILPVLTRTNTDGRTTIPVKLAIYAAGGGAVLDANREMYYNVVGESSTSVPDTYKMVFPWGYYEYALKDSGNTKLELSASAPRIGLREGTWGEYQMRIKRLWIEPNY